MRIAVFSDVHGNLAALNAVLDDIRLLAPNLIVNLGDAVSGPFDPAGSAEAQMTADVITIAGNHERQLLDDSEGAFDVLARPLLSEAHWNWIKGLPKTAALADGDVFACHGSPAGGDLDYLLEDTSSGRAVLASDDAIARRLVGIGDAHVVLCGHTHTPRIATTNSVLVVNPGSVGMPAYRDRGNPRMSWKPVAHWRSMPSLNAAPTADLPSLKLYRTISRLRLASQSSSGFLPSHMRLAPAACHSYNLR